MHSTHGLVILHQSYVILYDDSTFLLRWEIQPCSRGYYPDFFRLQYDGATNLLHDLEEQFHRLEQLDTSLQGKRRSKFRGKASVYRPGYSEMYLRMHACVCVCMYGHTEVMLDINHRLSQEMSNYD